MKPKNPKLFITITPDFEEKFTSWADRLGVTKSQFGSICMHAGLNSIIRAVSPEEGVPPDLMAQIMASAQRLGIDFSTTGVKTP